MGGGSRITIIDDQTQTLDVLRDVLEPDGHLVSCMTRVGPELQEIRDTRPDLVIIDLLLTDDQRELSGWDLVRLVRSNADLYRTPVLVISADYAQLQGIAGEAARLRDVSLLAKPFGVDELRAAVTASLGAAGTADAAGPSAAEGVSPGRSPGSSP